MLSAPAFRRSRPKELYTDLPMLNLLPAPDRVPPKGVYNCPLYKALAGQGTLRGRYWGPETFQNSIGHHRHTK